MLKKIIDESGEKIFWIVIPQNWFITIFCTFSHKTASFVARVRFCEAVSSGEVDTLPAHFTDEAWFSFNSHANIQNNRSWLADAYKLKHKVPLRDIKIGV